MGFVSRALVSALFGLVLAGCGTEKKAPDDADVAPRGGRAGAAGGAGTAGGAGVAGEAAGAGGAVAGASGTAGTIDCPTGQVSCAATCVDTASSGEHCGACNAACAAGASCVNGACVTRCATGQALCNGVCETIVSSAQNCGACANACPPPEVCQAGSCAADCGSLLACTGMNGIECADPMTNPSHCGACGAKCDAGLSCIGGLCVLDNCPEGQTACGGTCVNTETSSTSCGTCGAACPPGTPCIDGACGCDAGEILCQGECANILTSPEHCGACGAACGVAEVCQGGSCVPGCSGDLTLCDGSCVNTDTDDAHCGDCDTNCPSAQMCTSGNCTCPSGGTLCGNSCVDTAVDEAHCGDCDTACLEDQNCSSGTCRCPSGLVVCGMACVDSDTSLDHCGGCGRACSGGTLCDAGSCECPAGEVDCSGTCADLMTSTANCGACGQPCNVGQACTAGICTGAGGVGLDGCTGGTARNVTISRIDALQTVAVKVMDGGIEILPTSRYTDVIVNRETVLRVFVTLGSGWATHNISARATVVNGPASDEYYASRTVSSGSVESDLTSTFQILVPANRIKSTTSYHVELVECGTPPSEPVAAPRFPASDDVSLRARDVGGLKIRMVPILSNSRLPDTSDAALAPFREMLLAMYPLSNVEITVGSQITAAYPVDWVGTIDVLRAKREEDAPPDDVYYYGLIAPTDTYREYCLNGCTAGLGYVLPSANDVLYRVAMGVGFVDPQSYDTFAHELGHNHGREHAPCVWEGGTIEGVDPYYPYASAQLGVWGYDHRSNSFISPTAQTDVMAYCDPRWISDYTYDGIADRIAAVNGAKVHVNPNAFRRFRVLLVDENGLRWGAPLRGPIVPQGRAEVAEMLDRGGAVVEYGLVYRTVVSLPGAESILVPEPRRGWASLRLSGRATIGF